MRRLVSTQEERKFAPAFLFIIPHFSSLTVYCYHLCCAFYDWGTVKTAVNNDFRRHGLGWPQGFIVHKAVGSRCHIRVIGVTRHLENPRLFVAWALRHDEDLVRWNVQIEGAGIIDVAIIIGDDFGHIVVE